MSAISTSSYHRVAGRELHVTEWGHEHTEVVLAWHGLARTGRDMDDIAAHLAQRYRVLCPDTIGRGLSQWSPDPDREYCLAFYAQLAESLLDQLGIHRVLWLGTSMGGAIGLRAAAGALRGRIRKLVMNDIGPELPMAAQQRILNYAGNPSAFATVSELEAYFRTIYKPYGWLSDAQWRRLTEHLDAALARRPRDATTTRRWCASSLCIRTITSNGMHGIRSTSRCSRCAARRPTSCCPKSPSACATAARAPWWSRWLAAATRRR
jgi:pimeloyl-ACP methyl ester carboxylesterase